MKPIGTSSEDVLPSGDDSSDASDSDVKLVSADSDSDVRFAKPEAKAPGSDSDVRLVGTEEMATHHSDSDVRLTAPGSSMDIVGSGFLAAAVRISSWVAPRPSIWAIQAPMKAPYSSRKTAIALDTGSGMKVGSRSSADSGITLQSLADSGISLEKSDSGITLAGPMDSGIALDADSGIALNPTRTAASPSPPTAASHSMPIRAPRSASPKKEGRKESKKEKKPQRRDEREEKTISAVSGSDDFDDESTQVEVNMMDGEDDSGYKLHDDENEKTNVVLFADDDEESEDEPVAPPVKAKRPSQRQLRIARTRIGRRVRRGRGLQRR